MRRRLTKDAGDGTKVGEWGNFVPCASESICKPLHEKGAAESPQRQAADSAGTIATRTPEEMAARLLG